jgi:hypothetical protein
LRAAARGLIVSVVVRGVRENSTTPEEDGQRIRPPAPLLAWLGLAASFVVGLAGLIQMTGSAPAGEGRAGSALRLPGPMTVAIGTLFALAALVFLVNLLRRARRRPEDEAPELAPEAPPPPSWLLALRRILGLLYIATLAYLLWRGGFPLADILAFGTGSGMGAGAASTGLPSASPAISWSFGILALATGIGALGLALWAAFGDHLARWWEAGEDCPAAEPLERAVAESLEDLGADPDARRAIIRCYARFERVAGGSRVARRPSWTPAEFMREALAGGERLPRRPLVALTGLFELARFSHHPLGAGERDRALEALDEIRSALERHRSDAAP